MGETYEPQLVFFSSIDGAKFRRPVRPGDTVYYHVTKIRSRGRIFKFACEARVDGKLVAEAEIGAMIVESAMLTRVQQQSE
jgi:3-hydroxyacyl-[acyl-carrier-protein] dehydratase